MIRAEGLALYDSMSQQIFTMEAPSYVNFLYQKEQAAIAAANADKPKKAGKKGSKKKGKKGSKKKGKPNIDCLDGWFVVAVCVGPSPVPDPYPFLSWLFLVILLLICCRQKEKEEIDQCKAQIPWLKSCVTTNGQT